MPDQIVEPNQMGNVSQDSQTGEQLSDKDIAIYDELNHMQIDQLHKATLNFSNNSLETKKLCVTVETAVFALLAGIYKDTPIKNWLTLLAIFGIIIPLLFYVVDAVLWFYQNRLREQMLIEENYIRNRHSIDERKVNKLSNGHRVLKSLFNGSQAMYWGLIIVAGIILIASLIWRGCSA